MGVCGWNLYKTGKVHHFSNNKLNVTYVNMHISRKMYDVLCNRSPLKIIILLLLLTTTATTYNNNNNNNSSKKKGQQKMTKPVNTFIYKIYKWIHKYVLAEGKKEFFTKKKTF